MPIRRVKQPLADGVVDLVGAGVIEVLALEIDAGAAALLCQPLGKMKRARPADERFEQPVELGLEGRIAAGLFVLDRQLLQRVHQGFGDVAPAEFPESALRVGDLGGSTSRSGGRARHGEQVLGERHEVETSILGCPRRDRQQAAESHERPILESGGGRRHRAPSRREPRLIASRSRRAPAPG